MKNERDYSASFPSTLRVTFWARHLISIMFDTEMEAAKT